MSHVSRDMRHSELGVRLVDRADEAGWEQADATLRLTRGVVRSYVAASRRFRDHSRRQGGRRPQFSAAPSAGERERPAAGEALSTETHDPRHVRHMSRDTTRQTGRDSNPRYAGYAYNGFQTALGSTEFSSRASFPTPLEIAVGHVWGKRSRERAGAD
jgi:hypothetical protein